MAIALDATSQGAVNPATSLTFSHTCSGSNRILFVGIFTNDTGADNITGVTYGGVAMTLINKRGVVSSGLRYTYLYYLVAPATGANNVVISSSASELIGGVSVSYTGASQTGVPDAQTTNDGTNPTTTALTSIADNCWAILVGSDNNGNITASTGSTLRVTNATFAGLAMFDNGSAKTPAGSISMSTGGSNSAMRHCMATFAPAVATGGTVPISTLALLGVG